jgi:hypothetical protein
MMLLASKLTLLSLSRTSERPTTSGRDECQTLQNPRVVVRCKYALGRNSQGKKKKSSTGKIAKSSLEYRVFILSTKCM